MLEFDCTEDPNSMGPIAGGYFCPKCRHAVIDFTNWDRRSLQAYMHQHPGTCGQYRPEQLEPDLIPLSELLLLKGAVLVAGLTLGTVRISAQTPLPPATEQTAPTPGSDQQELLAEPAPVPSEDPDDIAARADQAPLAPTKRHIGRLHGYVSSRFPFVHVRRRILRGRMAYHIAF